jgi:hypothetical protein
LQKLDALLANADPRIAHELVGRELAALDGLQQRAEDAGYGIRIGPEGTSALVRIAGRIGGTPEGDALIQRMTDLPVSASQLQLAVAEGARPDLLVAFAANGATDRVFESATNGVQMYANDVVKGDVEALARETEELSWLISNHGGAMTPEQLNQAIEDYTAKQGPDWEKKVKALEDRVATDGRNLLDQIDSLRSAPAGKRDAANRTIDAILGDPKAQYAIGLALKQHPDYIDSGAGRRLMQAYAYNAKAGEQGFKLGRELANAYVRHNVFDAARNFDPGNPASVANAQAAIDKLKSPVLAQSLGISPSKLDNAAEALKKALPAAGDTEADIARRLRELDRALTTEDLKPAFDKKLPAGQLMRSLGLGFAALGFVNSTGKALSDPTLKNDLKAITDAAALGQKGTELWVGLGKISDDSLFGKFGSTASGRVFGLLSAGFDGWSAGESFSQGDWVKGSLYSASAVGGTLAALSGTGLAASLGIGAWAGPVGLVVVALSAIGLGVKDHVDQSNKHMNDTSAAFLQHAGFNGATAKALVDQSGEGWSPVTLLAEYARDKGYDLSDPTQQGRFVQWLNRMPIDQLEHVRDWAHHTLDEFDGDVSKLGADTTVVVSTGTVNTIAGPVTVMDAPRTVGQFDALLTWYGAPPLPVN